jgi:hypothetical protein
MAKHRRDVSSFDVEDSIWRFLRESTRYMQNIADSKSNALPEGDFSPASIIFRGFSTVFLLHRPQGSDLGTCFIDIPARNMLILNSRWQGKENPVEPTRSAP